jgi:hypothetical protein
MSREIRITIDDDEVFERMRRRKDELDLSWEEVLRRGLSEGDERGPGHHGRHPGPSGPVGPGSHHPGEREEFGRSERGPGGWNPFDPDFGQKLSEHIQRSVQESMPFEAEFGGTLEAEIGQLEDAEDAVLAFPFLADDPSNQVPMRVNLRTSSEGLAVEVVAVRRGKDVAEMNRFGADGRATVTRRLAAGEPAALCLRDGAEEYAVFPSLSWSRDSSGRPTVSEVEIESVEIERE